MPKAGVKYLLILIIFSTGFHILSFAETVESPLNLKQGELHCQTPKNPQTSGGLCFYRPVNTQVNDLRDFVIRDVFVDRNYDFRDKQGNVVGSLEISYGGLVLSFWHKDPAYLEAIKASVLKHDKNPPLGDVPNVEVVFHTQIFNIRKSAAQRFGIGLGGVISGNVDSSTAKGEFSGSNEGAQALINFGNLASDLLSLKLDLANSTDNLRTVTEFKFTARNTGNLNIGRTEPIYRDTTTNVIEKESGLKLNGRVYLNRDNPQQIYVSGFSLEYAIPTQNKSSVSVVSYHDDKIFLNGVPRVVAEETITSTLNVNQKAFPLFYGHDNQFEESILVIVVSAQIVEPPNLQDGLRLPEMAGFTENEIENLPEVDILSCVKKSFASAQTSVEAAPYSFRFGQRLLLKLDPQTACKSTYDRWVEVRLEGDGLEDEMVSTHRLEHLMKAGLEIPVVDLEPQRNSDVFQLEVTLELSEDLMPDNRKARRLSRRSEQELRLVYVPRVAEAEVFLE